jgi:arsenate reductase
LVEQDLQRKFRSAGLEPDKLNPLAMRVISEVGIDISKKKSQGVFDVFKSGQLFAYVITACAATSAEKCPIFPESATRLHRSFSDPSQVEGSETAKLEQVRVIRDQIREKIEVWCGEIRAQAATSAVLPQPTRLETRYNR